MRAYGVLQFRPGQERLNVGVVLWDADAQEACLAWTLARARAAYPALPAATVAAWAEWLVMLQRHLADAPATADRMAAILPPEGFGPYVGLALGPWGAAVAHGTLAEDLRTLAADLLGGSAGA